MTSRDVFRWIGILAVLEGLALAAGGRRTIRAVEGIVPGWYQLWLRPLTRVSPLVVRALGAAEVVFGLRLVALVPPPPRLLSRLAVAAWEPAVALWRSTAAHQADQEFGNLLRQYVPPGARVLDLGCDAGDSLARLLEDGLPFGSYVGVDSSAETLARARARFDGVPKVDFIRNDLLNDQLPAGEFDLILSAWALDRMPDPFALIVRAMRQLRHEGHAMLLFASPPSDWRAGPSRLVATLLGRQLHPASIYHGLPTFTAEQTFAGGLISLVILESPSPVPAPVRTSPPEQSYV